MLVPPKTNQLVVYQSDVIMGTWKFRPAGGTRRGITFDELVTIAHGLLISNPGKGDFIALYILEAATGEYGLCMIYKMPKDEARHAINREAEDHFLDKYVDFFQRSAGLAFKGHEGFRSHVGMIYNPRAKAPQE